MDKHSFHYEIINGKKVQKPTRCQDYYSNPKFFEQWWIKAQEEALAVKVMARKAKMKTRDRNKFGSIAHQDQTNLDTETGHTGGSPAVKITQGAGVQNLHQQEVEIHFNQSPHPQSQTHVAPNQPTPASTYQQSSVPPPPGVSSTSNNYHNQYSHDPTPAPPGGTQFYNQSPQPPRAPPPSTMREPPPPVPAAPPAPVVPPLPDIPPPDMGALPPPPDLKKSDGPTVQVKGGGLLGGLQNAKSGLKKAAVQEKKKTGRDAFLEQIRKNQKNRLKKVWPF